MGLTAFSTKPSMGAIDIITYKIHLIRTGRTGPAAVKRFAGQSDFPLCGGGVDDLMRLAEEFAYPKADMVFTSPLSRCVRTASILYPGVYTVEAPDFIDMGLGEFEGKTFEELKASPEFIKWLDNSSENPPPGGENAVAFTRRVLLALNDMFMRMMNEKISSAALITHGGVIMTLLASAGLPRLPIQRWAVDNGFGYTILMTPQMWMRDRACEVFSPIPLNQKDNPMDDDENSEIYTES